MVIPAKNEAEDMDVDLKIVAHGDCFLILYRLITALRWQTPPSAGRIGIPFNLGPTGPKFRLNWKLACVTVVHFIEGPGSDAAYIGTWPGLDSNGHAADAAFIYSVGLEQGS